VVTFEQVREFALTLPDAEERTSYGTPAFFVRKKLFVRLLPEAQHVMVKVDFDVRESLLADGPEVYSITPHYANYPGVLVELESVEFDDLADLIEDAWRTAAPKRLVAARYGDA
jgi:hypothetical protein